MARISSRLAGARGLGDAAGDDPAGMNALVAEQLDDVLAKAAQADAGAAQFRLGGDDAEDVARGGVGLHAEQQVGRGEIEEAQRVRLDHLRQVQHAAQLRGGVRNAHRHDGFAGLGRGDEVRDRADAADAGHEAGHLVERAAFGEFLEAAHLGDVKMRVLDFALALSWMVILPWPSRRVTGSMVMVWLMGSSNSLKGSIPISQTKAGRPGF
jgi:hypothetical protein